MAEGLVIMGDSERLTALLHELRVLATQARQRGDLRRVGDLPAEYWYGAQFGYEDAVERLEVLINEAKIANEGMNLGE